MGNCLFKKNSKSEELEAQFFFLQKENLRTYDMIIHELQNLKNSIYEYPVIGYNTKSVNPSRKETTV